MLSIVEKKNQPIKKLSGFTNQDFKAAIINMFKELKIALLIEFKETIIKMTK